jgi:ATP-dependent DNA helicase PIF1
MNVEQLAAFEAVKTGANVFLTGPAGSGKTYLINEILKWATEEKKPIALTALTGCAALLLGTTAKTLHSWAGVGLARDSVDALVVSITKNRHAKGRWKTTQLLIVDEISMMTPDLFEKLDLIGKRVRGSPRPWGGIQLVLCGDFCQLPPVVRGLSGESVTSGRFVFESPAWAACELRPVLLHKIERQTCPAFQTLLNECRIGAPSAESIALLAARQGLDWKSQLIRPTLLFSRNADVDMINEKNIAALGKPLRSFDVHTAIVDAPADDPSLDVPDGEALERTVSKLDNDANYAAHLELCVGAQVMLLTNKNIEAGLVNGSRGIIIDFNEVGFPVVQFMRGDPVAIGYHAWASRDNVRVCRQQIPLRVAYAITIHKSQGATLDCALIDIGSSTFEFGQAYVALSRVRDLNALYVHSLDPTKIRAHPSVVEFYERLATAPAPAVAAGGAGACAATTAVAVAEFGADLEDAGWKPVVSAWAATERGRECLAYVESRRAATEVFPPREHVLNALRHTPLSAVRVVILGQDPYHKLGQAHGLSFSVQPYVALPPSLRNIRKELLADLGAGAEWDPTIGTLTPWAQQGVLLLNTILTVESGKPESHEGIGWEELTHALLASVAAACPDAVFVAWGAKAQKVMKTITLKSPQHLLTSAHPSPLSAHNGFYGSKPFSAINARLRTPIDWSITAGRVELKI